MFICVSPPKSHTRDPSVGSAKLGSSGTFLSVAGDPEATWQPALLHQL